MMLFLLKTFISLLALLATCVLLPQLPLGLLRLVLRGAGWVIRKRTRSRREYIVSRVRADDEECQAKRAKPSPRGEDEDWEKVDSSSSSSGTTAGPSKESSKGRDENWDGIIGFFHPFCNAGGGGERVLWEAVRATQRRWPKAICAIYTGDHEVNKTAMLERVENRFNIQLHAPTVVLLYLTTRKYVLSSMYPYMTLLGQSLGSLVVAYDAFNLLVPDVFIDTMGYAFTLAFCKMLFPSVPTGAYVHYPTISTDMLQSLDDETGVKGVNAGAGKGLKGQAKRKYWLAFARLYGWVGGHVDVVMCNSSWTSAHIRAIWGPSRTRNTYRDPAVIFPPTAVSEIESTITVDAQSEKSREPVILYIAQFRPEKNHPLVLRSFARLLNERQKNPASASLPQPKILLIGSVRHASPDETHIYNLRLLAHELRIRDHTTFLVDASWPTILTHLRSASIGVNAMWNEHFGICVVEYQAAGLISVVHDSGGPREDIVVDLGDGATGFRAASEEQFAAAFEAALALPEEEKVAMRLRARRSALRFTEEEFSLKWVEEVGRLVEMR
ncbi:alpha-1,2-mannosyltransferase ALG11 [Aspergillus clavatus NRRL 1]|uniref:GDP-Man:Man(3)GlcNAc(2)-PP-Dol alpha-1,2-mannosyltransferase n=1 Tax=Aspergillus clavatus (strain ATCC 1007 / CBS 513.65 / DSM 816 / NCTC 3887 / NRRL 1 / QM 1276 / 107) TaxID=344612 RepID=A1CQX2_ASPCL|nr:alpha-1,2-mannosyltransferase (Alg11), putative [Aspergillus clavatus NRRL 1]EAW08043.1 alpha-1,2-mannosyltransferase (Alg11), putative [Aspergillus clavatus NRRL 1]